MNIVLKVIHHPEKIIFGLEHKGLMDWMSEEQYIKLVYRLVFKRKINLNNPITFTEKLNWYKLYYRDPLMKQCADKYEVRKYVAKTIGGGTSMSV